MLSRLLNSLTNFVLRLQRINLIALVSGFLAPGIASETTWGGSTWKETVFTHR